MSSYFFDTNFLFKIFFNRLSPEECELKDYIVNDSLKYISGNVEYEFSNIFLEFLNRFNHLLVGSYYLADDLRGNVTLKDFQNLTRDAEVLRYNRKPVTSMIWNNIASDKNGVPKSVFKNNLNAFILDFNGYFHLKYNYLMNLMTIHSRLEAYDEISDILKPYLHDSDLRICLDAHDVAVRNDLDDLAFVTADNAFIRNSDLIVENTRISEIIRI